MSDDTRGIRERLTGKFEKFILESVEWQRFRRDMLKNVAGSIDNIGKSASEITRAIAPWAAAFAESELAAERERCCKDVCESCRNGLSVILNEYGVWFHPEAPTSPFKCKADAIWGRARQEGSEG